MRVQRRFTPEAEQVLQESGWARSGGGTHPESEVLAKVHRLTVAITALLIQKTIVSCSGAIDSRWIIAICRPTSLDALPKPTTTATIAAGQQVSGIGGASNTVHAIRWPKMLACVDPRTYSCAG